MNRVISSRQFDKAFNALNAQQRQAVETIDGPVLVVAGPGTGKTQLLSTRVGYILQKTDVAPQNILCLTFTESGVEAMRERLSHLLGQEAYDVHVSTYHSFGSDLLRRYPEYTASYDFEPISDLEADGIIREILDAEPYSNPLKSAQTYAEDIRQLMSECKRALLKPADLQALADANLTYIGQASKKVSAIFKNFRRMGKTSAILFEQLYAELDRLPDKRQSRAESLKQVALDQLESALSQSDDLSFKSLMAWKNQWLAKDETGLFILAGEGINQKLGAAANIYATYQSTLVERQLYDYDDMILRAIEALQNNPDFKFTLAEQYQYILLDEFQDTNPAQFKIVELLTDNPVNEQRPNVLSVGDDDQAIYAFQGANHANMVRFTQIYRDVAVIPLHDNYRSRTEIIDVAAGTSSQINDRLHRQFKGITKTFKAANASLTKPAEISHHEFISDAAQYAWVAEEISQLALQEEIPLEEIAVLAPKHRYLIPLLPFLAAKKLPVRYEKRENVLDKPLVRALERMSRLVIALAEHDMAQVNALWPEVISYDFWGLSTDEIWQIGWQADHNKVGWTDTLLAGPKTAKIAKLFLRLKDLLSLTNLEQQLDILIGVSEPDVKLYSLPLRSPFYEYYFGKQKKDTTYLEMLEDLSVLRGRLRDWRRQAETPFSLADFVQFVDLHRASGINILNKSPHYEAKTAVNVMKAYQAKGREFRTVFILAAQDEVWGSTSHQANNKIGLPPNLAFIRYRGGSDDERLRLLYVAISRAKTHLYLTSYSSTMDGKKTRPLKYLIDQKSLQPIAAKPAEQLVSAIDMQNYWHLRHIPPFTPKLIDLLSAVMARYQLSPTHLNQFTDVINGGPEQFFLNTILRFPKGQTPQAQYGTAIHETIRQIHAFNTEHVKLPTLKQSLTFFEQRLKKQRLAQAQYELLKQRGEEALKVYLEQNGNRFKPTDRVEVNFAHEGVFNGSAHLTGKIDKLVMDKASKTITVVDFKTGKSYSSWRTNIANLHKYRQQLLFYKLLIEGSHSFVGWKVDKAVLEFVEPNNRGKIDILELTYNPEELKKLQKLIQAVWLCIQKMELPDVKQFPASVVGINAFEASLIA